ncbi:MAG: tetratricopeptide repeat protein [Cyanobacteria bacterium HKST-UBA02]|nr:tetratricopeptide repeat protein [Cyanobacteria bacterium HKST-UBA02]
MQTGPDWAAQYLIDRGLRLDDEDLVLLYCKARFLYQRYRFEEAEETATRAIRIYDDSATLALRSSIRLCLMRMDEAEQDATRSIEVGPKNYFGYLERAEVRSRAPGPEAPADALADVNHSIELYSNYSHSYQVRSDIYAQLGMYERSIKDARRALQLNRKDKTGFYRCRLAEVLLSSNYKEEAESILLDILGSGRRDYFVLSLASSLALSRNDFRSAERDAREIIETDNDHLRRWAAGYSELADALIELNRGREALAAAVHYIETVPHFSSGYLARARVLMRCGQIEEAMKDLDRAESVSPLSSGHHICRASSLLTSDRLEDALDQIDRAVGKRKLHSGSHAIRSMILTRLNRMKEARESAQHATSLDPDCVRSWLALGLVHEAEGDIKGAIAHISHAVDMHPLCPSLYENRARILEEAGKPEEALQDRAKFLELQDSFMS